MIDDYCCACITQGDCSAHPEHTCGLSREEIEADIAAREELMETYASLKPGEKKQVPSTGQWVTLTIGTNPAGGKCRQYEFCEAP